MTDRPSYKPLPIPPAYTGKLWLNPDKTLGGVISDVFLAPIHITGEKEDGGYRLRGWRGNQPEWSKIPFVDDAPHDDGLPSEPCSACEGKLYWRASVINDGRGGRDWHCVKCEPADPALWLDGVAVGKK